MRRIKDQQIVCLGKGGEVFLYKVAPENNMIGMKLLENYKPSEKIVVPISSCDLRSHEQ